MYLMKQSGWVEVICGSMFSGKSEELIRRVRRAQFAKQKMLYLNQKLIIVITKNLSFPIMDLLFRRSQFPIRLRFFIMLKRISILSPLMKFSFLMRGLSGWFSSWLTAAIASFVQVWIWISAGSRLGRCRRLMAIAESVTKLQAVCSVCGSPRAGRSG